MGLGEAREFVLRCGAVQITDGGVCTGLTNFISLWFLQGLNKNLYGKIRKFKTKIISSI